VKLFIPYWYDVALSPVVLAAGLLGISLATALTIKFRIQYGYFAVGWLWFLGTLVPVIGIVQVGAQSAADRYTYIPSIGFLIGLVWGTSDLIARSRMPKALAAVIVAALLCVSATLTTRQLWHWRNSKALLSMLWHGSFQSSGGGSLAWTYAADPDPSLRNAAEAVRLAS
jgi:hypothetical protein